MMDIDGAQVGERTGTGTGIGIGVRGDVVNGAAASSSSSGGRPKSISALPSLLSDTDSLFSRLEGWMLRHPTEVVCSLSDLDMSSSSSSSGRRLPDLSLQVARSLEPTRGLTLYSRTTGKGPMINVVAATTRTTTSTTKAGFKKGSGRCKAAPCPLQTRPVIVSPLAALDVVARQKFLPQSVYDRPRLRERERERQRLRQRPKEKEAGVAHFGAVLFDATDQDWVKVEEGFWTADGDKRVELEWGQVEVDMGTTDGPCIPCHDTLSRLRTVHGIDMPGVTSPTVRLVSAGYSMGWTRTICDFATTYVNIYGAPIILYTIKQASASAFQSYMRPLVSAVPGSVGICDCPRAIHHPIILDPKALRDKGIDVDRAVLSPGQIVIIAPGTYWMVLALGVSCIQTSPILTPSWSLYHQPTALICGRDPLFDQWYTLSRHLDLYCGIVLPSPRGPAARPVLESQEVEVDKSNVVAPLSPLLAGGGGRGGKGEGTDS